MYSDDIKCTGTEVKLLNNGLVLVKNGKWHIRRYDPNEKDELKWDVWTGTNWGADSLMCIVDNTLGYNTIQEAFKVAMTLQ